MALNGQDETTDFIAEGIGKKEPEVVLPEHNQAVPTPSAADLMRYNPYGDAAPAVETGALPNTTYFPGINQPIAKGNFSGQTTGSYTTMAANAYMPYGIIDNRAKAFEDAAMKKAQELQALRNKAYNAPQLKNPYQQKKMDEEYYGWLDKTKSEYQKMYPNDWEKRMLYSDQFQRTVKNYETVKLQDDVIYDTASKVYSDWGKGGNKAWMPSSVKAEADAVIGGLKDLADYGGNMSADIQKLRLYNDLGTVLNESLKDVDGFKTAYINKNFGLSTADYDALETTTKTKYDTQMKKDLAQDIHDRYYGDSGVMSLEEVERLVDAKLTDSTEKKLATARKFNAEAERQKAAIKKAGKKNEYTENDKQYNQEHNIGVMLVDETTGLPKADQQTGSVKSDLVSNTYSRTAHKSPVAAKTIFTPSVVNSETGERFKEGSQGVFTLGETMVAPVYKKGSKGPGGVDISGKIVPTKDIQKAINEGAVEYDVMTTGTVNYVKDGQELSAPITRKASEVKDPLTEEGIPYDSFVKDAADANKQLKETKKPAKYGQKSSGLKTVTTQAEFDALPSGTKAIDSEGNIFTKP